MIAMKQPRLRPIGLELSPQSARLVQLAGRPDALSVHVMASASLPHDENTSPEDRDRSISASLKRLLNDHPFKGRRAVSCLDSHELFMQNVRLPQLPDDELAKIIAIEAEERLPYAAADAEIRHLRAGPVRQESTVKDEVILLAHPRKAVDRHIRVLEQAGLVPLAIDVQPCAALRCLREADHEDSSQILRRRAYLNLSATATTIAFAEGDQILFLKDIGIGGNDLDQAVLRHLELDLPEAAGMRRSVMDAPRLDPDNEIHRSVVDAIREPLETMAAEIQLCLRYYKVTFRGKPIDKMVVAGCEGSQLLMEFLADRLSTPCELANPFAALAQQPTSQAQLAEPWQWTTAVGLSMWPTETEKTEGTQ